MEKHITARLSELIIVGLLYINLTSLSTTFYFTDSFSDNKKDAKTAFEYAYLIV